MRGAFADRGVRVGSLDLSGWGNLVEFGLIESTLAPSSYAAITLSLLPEEKRSPLESCPAQLGGAHEQHSPRRAEHDAQSAMC